MNGQNKIKEKMYHCLCQLFGKDDVICNKPKDDKYPWVSDFYIISRKLYIEDFTDKVHHGHLFNCDNDVDVAILKQIKSKEEIDIWSNIDVNKHKYGNVLFFYTYSEFEKWFKIYKENIKEEIKMRSLRESLMLSYNHEDLIKKLKKEYNILQIHKNSDYSKARDFCIVVSNNEYPNLEKDIKFNKILNFYGYYITDKTRKDKDNEIYVLEPIYADKANKLVYKECNGIVWHVTKNENLESILHKGIYPKKDSNYRKFSSRVFFTCGKTRQEIFDNVKFIIKEQLQFAKYNILKVDVNKYNVNFYYDTLNKKEHNCVYSNAIFYPSLITNIADNLNDFEDYLDNIILKSEDIKNEDLYGKVFYEQKYTLNGHTEEDNGLDINKLIFRGYRDII